MRYILSTLCIVLASTIVQAQSNQTNEQKAVEHYAQRDFNKDGIANVEKSIEYYKAAIDEESDNNKKLNLQTLLSQAYYFLGTAYEDEDVRKQSHKDGLEIAEAVVDALGVKDPHELTKKQVEKIQAEKSVEEIQILMEAIYYEATNLAQWGRLNGITSSLGKLPEVIGNLDSIELFGYESIHHYGPYRTVGRIRFILPGLVGGDLEESEEKLKTTFKNTLADGEKYSVEGYTNVYLAETLEKRGKSSQAAQVIKAFIESDPATWAEDSIPENNQALERAKELAEEWKI